MGHDVSSIEFIYGESASQKALSRELCIASAMPRMGVL
jgi:hypothetical protein